MTDPHRHAGLPEPGASAPTFFDPSFERLPAPVAGETATPGPVLLVFDRAADRNWVADAAVALATGWHAAGRRTVLADLCLDEPFLSERIGMPNQEGVVDIFLYGASLARSARAVPGRGFYLISAGTYTPDAGEVLRSPRWEKIVGGFREANAALLLFAPADAPELAALGRYADSAIVLGGGDGRPALPQALDGTELRAWLAPPRREDGGPRAAPASPADRFPEPEPVAPWNAPPGTYTPPPPPAPDALPTAAEAVYAAPTDLPALEPERAETRAKKKPAVSPLLLLLLLVALLAALVFLGPQLIPGFPNLLGAAEAETPAAAPAPRQVASKAPPALAAPAEPEGASLPYSVYVANFQTFTEASKFAMDVSGKFSEAEFFVFPEPRDGVVWWRVMAGMASDTTAVLALRDRLLAEGIVDQDEVGGRYDLIQSRPLAYDLGEYPNVQEATARAESLATRQIPAYVTPVPYSDGSERWKVYAGAYRDSASAAPLKRILDGARVPGKVVERTGRPPASPK